MDMREEAQTHGDEVGINERRAFTLAKQKYYKATTTRGTEKLN